MKNPYLILNISQNATEEEIELARRYQLKLQCGNDVNMKNEEGEYIQEVINQAADDLLDSNKRKGIDENLSNRSPIIYNSNHLPLAQIVLTKINQELVTEMQNIKLESKHFDKRVKVKNLSIFILENYYIGFAKLKTDIFGISEVKEYFTDKRLLSSTDTTWKFKNLKPVEVDGLLAIAYPAYQILPASTIQNGRVRDSLLRQLHPILQKIMSNKMDEIDFGFQQEKEKLKEEAEKKEKEKLKEKKK